MSFSIRKIQITTFHTQLTPIYSVVIFALALLLGSGIIAGLQKSDLLSVRAEENADVSDGDLSSEISDIVSPGDNTEETVFVNSAEPLRAYADPELASFPFTMKHVILMDDGTTVSTVPAESTLSDGSVYNLSEGSKLNVTSVPRTDETTSGTLYQGLDMELYFHGGLANVTGSNVRDFVGEVILHLSDGSDLTWNCGDARYTTVNSLFQHHCGRRVRQRDLRSQDQ